MYDVFSFAKRLRQQRRGLIDGVEQYKFVYECLEEAFKSSKTWFPVSDLAIKMKWKSIRDQVTKINEYQREYEKILKVTPRFTTGDCAGGHRVENRSKNRDVLTIPPDNHRPYLTTFQTNDSTDYVNGVFVDVSFTDETVFCFLFFGFAVAADQCGIDFSFYGGLTANRST